MNQSTKLSITFLILTLCLLPFVYGGFSLTVSHAKNNNFTSQKTNCCQALGHILQKQNFALPNNSTLAIFAPCCPTAKKLLIQNCVQQALQNLAGKNQTKALLYADSAVIYYQQYLKLLPPVFSTPTAPNEHKTDAYLSGEIGYMWYQIYPDSLSLWAGKIDTALSFLAQNANSNWFVPHLKSKIDKAQRAIITPSEVLNTYAFLHCYITDLAAADTVDFRENTYFQNLQNQLSQLLDKFEWAQNYLQNPPTTCTEALEKATALVQRNPSDMVAIRMGLAWLWRHKCEQHPLFKQLLFSLYKTQPTAYDAYLLATIYLEKGDFAKAESYLQDACSLTSNAEAKSQARYDLAKLIFKRTGTTKMATQNTGLLMQTYLTEATALNPYWGRPYLLQGQLYEAAYPCTDTLLNKAALYWLAADYYQKAIEANALLINEGEQALKNATAFFPDTKELQNAGCDTLTAKPYFVGCWINQYTAIKARK